MTTDTKRKPEDKIAEPPKKWRNWYRCLKPFVCSIENRAFSEGEVFCGLRLWPSKDAAETAVERVPPQYNPVVWGVASYLGAEPEQ